MDKPMNTYHEFKLANGDTVKLTLNFYFLYQLKNNHKALYDRYNKIMQSTDKNDMDIIDMVTICYVGYVCANLSNEALLSEEDFYLLCGNNMRAVGEAVKALIAPKNK